MLCKWIPKDKEDNVRDKPEEGRKTTQKTQGEAQTKTHADLKAPRSSRDGGAT